MSVILNIATTENGNGSKENTTLIASSRYSGNQAEYAGLLVSWGPTVHFWHKWVPQRH
jgi:hypothetical protein